MPDFGFIGGAYTSWSPNAAADVCMNLFPEKIENEGRYALYGTPGLTLFGTLPHSPVRGVWAGANRLFAVAGSKLYEVFFDGTHFERGDVETDAHNTPVDILVNGTQIAVVSNGHLFIDSGDNSGPQKQTFPDLGGTCNTIGYLVTWVSGDMFDASMVGEQIAITGGAGSGAYNIVNCLNSTQLLLDSAGTAPGTLTSVAFTVKSAVLASSGTFLDTYFVVSKPNTASFNISDVGNTSAQWNPIDFGIKEGYPDALVRPFADHEQLWLFGTDTIEIWQNTGAAAFPFERIPGAFIPHGLVSAQAVARLMESVAWLSIDESRGGIVAYIASGFIPKRISTHAVEQIWRTYTGAFATGLNDSKVVSYTYVDQGHEFWVITFPNDPSGSPAIPSATWVFDATENLWHQRGWWDSGTSANIRQKGQVHAYCFGQHIVGDWSSGNLYTMDMGTHQDNGTGVAGAAVPIHRIRAAQEPPPPDMDWTTASRFRLYAEGASLTPSLDWSDSGGVTFNTPRTTASQSAGALAVYDWRRLGRYRSRVWRVTITDNAKVALIDGYVRKAA